jgi:hypothetical protein
VGLGDLLDLRDDHQVVLQRRRGVQLLSPSRATAASSPRSRRLQAPLGRCLLAAEPPPTSATGPLPLARR